MVLPRLQPPLQKEKLKNPPPDLNLVKPLHLNLVKPPHLNLAEPPLEPEQVDVLDKQLLNIHLEILPHIPQINVVEK